MYQACTPLIPQPSSGTVGVVRQVWDAVDSLPSWSEAYGAFLPPVQRLCVQQLP